MRFDNIFSRADDETLQLLLGRAGKRLINVLHENISSERLRGLILNLYPREVILLSPNKRNHIIDLLRVEEAHQLGSLLKVDSKNIFEKLKKIRISKNSPLEKKILDFFEVPFHPTEKTKEIESEMVLSPPYQLFSYQRKAARRITSILESGYSRVVLHMPTGSGKTRTAMNIAVDHFRSREPALVVWLAYSEELCEQAMTEFVTAWNTLGDRELQSFRYWGNHEIDMNLICDGFIVAGFSKIYSRIKNEIQFINLLSKKSTLIIVDEAHQAIAETYKLILDALTSQDQTKGLLGLTATPGRSYNDISLDEELASFFNKQKVVLEIEGYDNPIKYLTEHGYLAKATFLPLFYEQGFNLSERDKDKIRDELDVPQSILTKLAEDEMRSLKIITEIERLININQHKRIIIFATTVEHSKLLASILTLRDIEAFSLTSDTSKESRPQIIKRYKSNAETPIVLCNFGVLTTGFDAPQTSAAIIARPTKSLVLYSQMVGRALRGERSGGNKSAEIITVVDFDLPGFRSPEEAFTNWEDVYNPMTQ